MGIGFSELMIILIIIMIIFGAGKLPEIGTAFGNTIRNFKKSMKDADEADVAAEQAANDSVPEASKGALSEGNNTNTDAQTTPASQATAEDKP